MLQDLNEMFEKGQESLYGNNRRKVVESNGALHEWFVCFSLFSQPRFSGTLRLWCVCVCVCACVCPPRRICSERRLSLCVQCSRFVCCGGLNSKWMQR